MKTRMNTRMKTLSRIAIGALCAFYLAVAWTAVHPQVSPAYRAYYIEGSDFMSPWQHRQLAPLAPASEHGADDPALMFDGWPARGDGQRWNGGRSARLVFRVDGHALAAGPHALTLRLLPLGTQASEWRLNGQAIGSHRLQGASVLRLDLAPGSLRPGENELRVTLPDARVVGKGNLRMWALRFDGLRWD
jgi:hypothetical protein